MNLKCIYDIARGNLSGIGISLIQYYFLFIRIRIDQTTLKKTFESYDPDHYQLLEGEERRYMDPESQKVSLI